MTLINGQSYNIANAVGPSVFVRSNLPNVKANYYENISFVTDSGVSVIITYNQYCSFNSADGNRSCYMALIDVNGDKSPNKVGEDVYVINAGGFLIDSPDVMLSDDVLNPMVETTGVNQAKKFY